MCRQTISIKIVVVASKNTLPMEDDALMDSNQGNWSSEHCELITVALDKPCLKLLMKLTHERHFNFSAYRKTGTVHESFLFIHCAGRVTSRRKTWSPRRGRLVAKMSTVTAVRFWTGSPVEYTSIPPGTANRAIHSGSTTFQLIQSTRRNLFDKAKSQS